MDTISDFFVRITNGYRAEKPMVIVPFSRMKADIARLLAERGFIASFEKKGRKVRKFLEVHLKYDNKRPAVQGVKRLSKSSRRLYIRAIQIRHVRQGYGMLIVSTSRGVLSGEEAKKNRLGGELIAEVW